MVTRGPREGDSQMFMQHSGLIICGRKCGQARWKLNKNKTGTGRLNKTKLDNARKLTGKHIDLHDMEFKDIMKSARKELEVHATLGTERPSAQRLPTLADQKYACIVEAHESTRTRSAKSRRDIAEKGAQFLDTPQCVSTKPIPILRTMEIPARCESRC